MHKNSTLDWIAYILLIVGGLNWGLVGAFNYNLVSMIFGSASTITRIIYVLVGISAIYVIAMCGKKCKASTTGASM